MRTMTTCVAAAMLLLAVSACSPEESEDGDGSIVFWTPYTTPERIAAQQPVIDAFTEATGIEVEMSRSNRTRPGRPSSRPPPPATCPT
jgi:multiple sugar transport system substrate-binding protein